MTTAIRSLYFGSSVRIDRTEHLHVDLERPDFKDWTILYRPETQTFSITPGNADGVIVSVTNVRYWYEGTPERVEEDDGSSPPTNSDAQRPNVGVGTRRRKKIPL